MFTSNPINCSVERQGYLLSYKNQNLLHQEANPAYGLFCMSHQLRMVWTFFNGYLKNKKQNKIKEEYATEFTYGLQSLTFEKA